MRGVYLDAARRIGEFLREFRNDSGSYQGFFGGVEEPESPNPVYRDWASTEHNLDVHAAAGMMCQITGEPVWLDDAEHARVFVDAMWDSQRGCYLTGTHDPETLNDTPGQLPLDVHTWRVLAVADTPPSHLAEVFDCIEAHHRNEHHGFDGYDFNEDRDGVWFEGLGQAATAYAVAGWSEAAETLRAELRRAQQTAPFGNGYGIAAACHDGLTTGFGFQYFQRLHIGATSWLVFSQLEANPYYAVPDLGPVDFLLLDGLDPSVRDLWYSLQTTHQGILTIEAWSPGESENIQLALYDQDSNLLAVGGLSNDNQRMDWQTDSATTYLLKLSGTLADVHLRLANLVQVSADGSSVTVYDHPGNDTFAAFPASPFVMFINDVKYKFAGVVDVHAYASGGDFDVAKLYDSPGNDSFVATPVNATLEAAGLSVKVEGFDGVHAYATAGGIDVAKFYDSPGNDNYVAAPICAAMFNDEYYIRAKYFEGVHAYATAGGTDLARFYDSPANDDFVATPTYAALYNNTYRQEYTHGFYNRAKYFRGAHAYATAGGVDLARLYDSPEDDKFYADPVHGALYNDTYQREYTEGFYNRAKFFEGVHAYATADGTDEARLHGSGGNDKFYADVTHGAMYLPGEYYNCAKHFERVYADAREANGDQALLKGLDEMDPEEGWLRRCDPGGSIFYWLREFEDIIANPAPLGQGEQQEVGNKARLLALDAVFGNEGPGGPR